MGCRSLLLSAMIFAAFAAVRAQTPVPAFGLGTTPSTNEIRAWKISIDPEGKDLPAGSGTADEGAKIYEQKCAMCHGPNGKDGQGPALVPSTSAHLTPFPVQLPFATVLWDYIRRAMPMLIGPGTLKTDEVYSLTAYLLYKNDLIKENDVLDAQTLPKVKMPRRDAFVPPVTKP